MVDYSKLKLASDIEAKGFYDVVNTKDDVHCLCSIDMDSGQVYLFHNHPEFDNVKVKDPYDGKEYTIPSRTGDLDAGVAFWAEVGKAGGMLIIHNAHTYDRPVIDKIWPDNGIPFEAYHDTFNRSKVQWFERPTPKGAKSPHGLKAYGILLGINKPEVEDWSYIDAFKLHRCIEDCKIQAGAYDKLEQEANYLKKTYGIDFTTALKIEDLYADECFKQEVYGALIDVPHVKRCVKFLDETLETLREEIEPHLPPTIKGSTPKISRSEMAELFGYDPSLVKDKVIQKKKDGDIIDTVEKPYYKPTMDYTNKVNINWYEGYHVSFGFSPKFNKKKELTDWIKEEHPSTKNKEWNIEKTVEKTTVVNKYHCEYFGIKPESALIGGPFTRICISPSSMTQNDVVKAYLIQLGWKHAEEWNLKKDVKGEWIKVDKDTEVRWPAGASHEHQLVKYIKKGGYMVSSPQLSEEDFDQLPEGIGKKIGQYNTYQHRRRFLENPKDPDNKGLLSYVREDGRIPCGVNNFGTRSGRGSQRVWVNAPSEGALFGGEIRKCIIAPEGKSLVGIDMKSAQLSIAAYFANNWNYYDSVASGLEFTTEGKYVGETAHCVNARMFGLVEERLWKKAVETQDKELIHKLSLIRKGGKGGSFAVIFGASGKKVATTLGIPEREGNKAKDRFLKQMGLDNVIKKLGEYETLYPYKRGFYIPLAFGYWLWNNSSHKSVNTDVQGYEALAQKLAVVRLAREAKRVGLDDKFNKIVDTHDEVLLEVTNGYEDEVGKLAGECYTWAAEQIFQYHTRNPEHFPNYNPPLFSIDLNGGYKVGSNYHEVH